MQLGKGVEEINEVMSAMWSFACNYVRSVLKQFSEYDAHPSSVTKEPFPEYFRVPLYVVWPPWLCIGVVLKKID